MNEHWVPLGQQTFDLIIGQSRVRLGLNIDHPSRGTEGVYMGFKDGWIKLDLVERGIGGWFPKDVEVLVEGKKEPRPIYE